MKKYGFIIGIMLSIGSVATAEEISFYVSPSGNDNWSGRFAEPRDNDGPFATFFRAQMAVRELAMDSLAQPVVVYFRGGVYNLDKKIFFLPEDSGTKEAPITYRAFEDEEVLISGGRQLTGWRYMRDNQWVCDVPEGRTFQALFVNGERRYRASTPNDGFYRVKDPMEGKDWPFHHYRYEFGFYPGDILSNWKNLQDVQVVLLHFWSDARSPIESVDAKTLTVRLSTPIWRRFTDDNTTAGARYFIDNVYEGMDEPGEWYLDRSQGKLYYLAFPDEDVAAAEIIAPFFDQLLIFLGSPMKREYVEHIHLHGFDFAYTDWQLPPGDSGDHFAADMVPAAVEATGSRDISISDCSFEHIGSYGIGIYDGCRDVRINRNVLRDLAAGGIQISGGSASEDSLLKTSQIIVTDNVLFDLGRIYYSGIGILLMHASECRIAHNHIRDLYYTGISVGKEWGYKPSAAFANRIEYNHVENAGQRLLSDMGGIYMLGISPGTVIRNNLVHGIYTHGYGGWGIYTDEGSSGILVEKNIVYDTKSAGFHQHYGRDNLVRNNIFADGGIAQIMRSRDEDHLSFRFQRNIVYWQESELLASSWRGDTSNFNFQDNLYYRRDGAPIRFLKSSIAEWQESGQDTASLFGDPQFVDAANGDFDLEETSPAFALGFEPIDRTAIGPRFWPEEVREIEYLSAADSSMQPALYYDSGSSHAKPLLVGLHSWSADYRQEANVPLAKWCLQKDWVFIHPDFRGPNRTPQATGSQLVVADILSAVDYARQHENVDSSRIYLIGASGGGYTALQVVAHAPQLWAGVSVWAPISDLVEWYHESAARGNAYADMLVASCGGVPGESDSVDAQYDQRSPRHFLQNAMSVALDINAGLQDGHTGSVPVSHALRAFNVLAADEQKLSDEQIDYFVTRAAVPAELQEDHDDPYYSDKHVLFRRTSNKARVTLFDGGHEIIPNAALHWLQRQAKQ
ncbi:right-handed parallel beta-helix repeat-containing protein [candidate division KSB1 bacterium]|nr:right-handed parallel beta-helix repeat-containing protein [candidate division KSB1 bacterium]RQW08108.1 MAG: hypothetical protein EH222_06040 [candidate division KSB1 bacterium]